MMSKHFKVEQLRAKNISKSLEGILVLLTCFFAVAFLPQLLIQYVYANQQLFEQPAALQYLPVVIFVIGMGYFLFVMLGNLRREMTAQKLEKEVELMGHDCCGGECCDHDEKMDSVFTMSKADVDAKTTGTTSSIAEALKASKSTGARKSNKRK